MSKKILFITRPLSPPWDEASKNFAFDLAQNVAGDVTILVSEENPNLPTHVTQKKAYSSVRFGLLQKIELLSFLLMRAKDFDIIHFLFTPTKLNAALLRFLIPKKARTVQTVATIREDLYSPAALRKVFFANQLVTYAAVAAKRLTALGFSNVTHVHPGINFEKFVPGKKDGALLTKWRATVDAVIFLFPGEYTRLGGVEHIISAFLGAQLSDARLVIGCRVKNDADKKKRAELMMHYKTAPNVVFDPVEDYPKALQTADVVLFPVLSMTGKFDVPLALVESYVAARPTIVTDLPRLREFSADTMNVIIPTGDENALTTAIKALAADPEKRLALGMAAQSYVKEHFDITSIAKSYNALYEKL